MNTEMEQHYAARAKQLSEIRGRFTANVVRWLYSSSEIWSWEDRRRKGRDEDILPTSEGALYGCGFDAADQPIVLQQFENERIWDESRGGLRKPLPGVWLEEFIAHNGDELEVTRFARGELELISRRRFEGHRLLEEESVRHGVYQRTVIKRTEANTKLIQTFNNKGQLYHEVIYGLHGEKSYFRVRRDGTRFQLYQPLPKGVKIKTLKETVRERLMALVPQVVAAAKIREPIYCVALVYDDEGNDSLPPLIGVGLESERVRWKTEHGKRARDFVWNPAEFHHYEKSHTQIFDEELEEACDFLNTKWAEGASAAPAAKLLEETAAALNHVAWPESIERTDDFVVYAVGLEGSGLRRSLKASLTAEKFGMLKVQGMV